MSLLAVASRVRRIVFALTAVTLASCASTNVDAATAVGPTLLPTGSVAYLHVQVADLNNTPFARLPAELISHVRNELANLTVHNFGIDATQLSEITIVVPPLEVLQSHDSSAPPFVIAATFSNKFNPDDVMNNLPEGWERSNLGNATVFMDSEGNTVHAATPRTLLFGAQSTLAWWIGAQSQPQDSRLPELLRESLGTGQVFFGADFNTIPQEALQALPPQLATLLKAELASATLNLDDQITLNFNLGYDGDKSAKQAKQELVSLQKQGRAILQYQEAEFQRQLTDANHEVDASMEAIGALAITRQVAAYLDNLKLTQEDAWISTSLQIDSSVFILAGITAIGSTNRGATEMFEDVSNEISDSDSFDDSDEESYEDESTGDE